ncbi:YecA family protein [Sneathiella chinensis]|uniref:Preprotein translocase subunit SecA n=1 Tax=Sneathiella chinensis TaxID=349750 RepID=A0ABQ5U6S9_9PROT|nr:SEC-C metal-binding domain-containing protein [Sneathiella chinensis]GLQ07598.1 hypothetical protein GCM10007924_28190 [Sneathiella chinensis]
MYGEENRKLAATSSLKNMEVIAAEMRELIVSIPPLDLLGYIYAQLLIEPKETGYAPKGQQHLNSPSDLKNQTQFLLEYVHAVLASDAEPVDMIFDEARCNQLLELGIKLREQAIVFAMATSADARGGIFGPSTAKIEFHAKSAWLTIRGNRYQVLEGEFYNYVLAPHNDVLEEVYGIGSAEVAEGFQEMAESMRSGILDAATVAMEDCKAVQAFSLAQGKSMEDVVEVWEASNPEHSKAVEEAIDDMFRGGVANVSRHTKLPSTLLADLSYRRGEDTEFFAAGDFVGTPYRTLPARKKPLIQIGSDYYALDFCFARDAGYRALLYNLLQRKPDYKKTFEERQKAMSEAAFVDILSAQLPGATVLQEVYYKDPISKQWSENDTLILIDDVLFLVEAKAGAAATIASPALDFDRHAQSVQDLFLKAYKQCERFFNYLNSADEVPLYHFVAGKYQKCANVRCADYRVMVPVGLTVESFSPFSTYCKELPQVGPLLGKHAFVSLSIDDLFVLKRLLPTPGEFIHYMEVRQNLAGMKGVRLYDEFDHLGGYLMQNRFDLDLDRMLGAGKANMLFLDGMSDIVDKAFEGMNWKNESFPTQDIPEEMRKLLGALDATRYPGWLEAESHIRDLGEGGRNNFAKMLCDFRQTLEQHPFCYFTLYGEGEPLFVWLQKSGHQIDWPQVNDKASAVALATKASKVVGLVAEVEVDGVYRRAEAFEVRIPAGKTGGNTHIYEDAMRMARSDRLIKLNRSTETFSPVKRKKVGRNSPCPCGSGVKYKKCHGR